LCNTSDLALVFEIPGRESISSHSSDIPSAGQLWACDLFRTSLFSAPEITRLDVLCSKAQFPVSQLWKAGALGTTHFKKNKSHGPVVLTDVLPPRSKDLSCMERIQGED
jgi:hypothetical protein